MKSILWLLILIFLQGIEAKNHIGQLLLNPVPTSKRYNQSLFGSNPALVVQSKHKKLTRHLLWYGDGTSEWVKEEPRHQFIPCKIDIAGKQREILQFKTGKFPTYTWRTDAGPSQDERFKRDALAGAKKLKLEPLLPIKLIGLSEDSVYDPRGIAGLGYWQLDSYPKPNSIETRFFHLQAGNQKGWSNPIDLSVSWPLQPISKKGHDNQVHEFLEINNIHGYIGPPMIASFQKHYTYFIMDTKDVRLHLDEMTMVLAPKGKRPVPDPIKNLHRFTQVIDLIHFKTKSKYALSSVVHLRNPQTQQHLINYHSATKKLAILIDTFQPEVYHFQFEDDNRDGVNDWVLRTYRIGGHGEEDFNTMIIDGNSFKTGFRLLSPTLKELFK